MTNVQNAEKYDVVIIGAGPGGLRCAQVLGEAGKKVLIVEKKNVIGPKVCAGGLTRKAITYLQAIGLPQNIIERSFNNIIFRKGTFKTCIDFGGTFLYTINRKNLGQWQVKQLERMQNVTVYEGKTVTEIADGHVVIDGKQFVTYEFLVGADGSSSIVRRFLRVPTELFGVAYQYVVPMQDEQYENIEIVFDNKYFHAWYAWIFPYAQHVSIGAGYFPKLLSAKTSMDKFDQWLKEERISVSGCALEAHPINCDYRGYHFGNVFLVGDAAGVASGFTGEGIYQALIFGEEVAQMIVNNNYKSKMIPQVIHEKHVHEMLLRIVLLCGPFRNAIFYIVVLAVKIPWCGRTLLRILS